MLILMKTQISSAQQFEAVMRKAYVLLTRAQERDRQAAEKLDDIKTRRIRSEEDLVDAEEHNSISKQDKLKAENQIKALRKQEAEAVKSRKAANSFLSETTEIIKAPEKKRYNFIADYEKKYGKLEKDVPSAPSTEIATQAPAEPVSTTETTKETPQTVETKTDTEGAIIEVPTPEKGDKKNKKDKIKPKKEDKKPAKNAPVLVKQAAKYNPQMDVALNPPLGDCVLAFDGVDNFTQRKKRETAPQILFRHTEDFMKATLKDKDYINCEVMASRVQGGFYFLNLSFTILSKEAQRSFGFLDKGTSFVFKLTNGRILTLMSTKTDIGTVDMNKGTTVYKAQLQLTGSDVKQFSEAELDIFRVAWSAGYEDYEIYNMDVLQNIFKCLDKDAK